MCVCACCVTVVFVDECVCKSVYRLHGASWEKLVVLQPECVVFLSAPSRWGATTSMPARSLTLWYIC